MIRLQNALFSLDECFISDLSRKIFIYHRHFLGSNSDDGHVNLAVNIVILHVLFVLKVRFSCKICYLDNMNDFLMTCLLKYCNLMAFYLIDEL